MSFIKVKEIVKRLLQADRWYFYYINRKYNLNLSFQSNRNQINIFKEVFYHKVYDLGFPKGIENGVIVDIGAHYGYFSIYASKRLGNHSTVYAVEASKDNFFHLRQNIDASKVNNITAFQMGISGVTSDRMLYNAKSWNNSLFADYLDHMQEGDIVICLSLADFFNAQKIQRVDFLKIDCEGAEHEILQHADKETLRKIKIISMEIHDMRHCGWSSDKTLDILMRAGFEPVYSDYETKKHKRGYNAKVVMKMTETNKPISLASSLS